MYYQPLKTIMKNYYLAVQMTGGLIKLPVFLS